MIVSSDNIITLHTKNTSYQFKIDRYGYVIHTWYGKRIHEHEDMGYRFHQVNRGNSGQPYEVSDRTYSLDTMPQEYSTFGNGDYRADSIQVVHPDGSNVLNLKYEAHDIIKGKYDLEGLPSFFWDEEDGETLVLTLADEVEGIKVELFYGVLEKYDIITRAARIINTTDEVRYVKKAYSACLDFIDGVDDLIHFHGKHNMEREFERNPLLHGRIGIESNRGISSHQANPFVILAQKDTNEVAGSCYGIALVYSGSFKMEIEMDQINQTRVVAGLHPEQLYFRLKKDEVLTLPEVVLTYSDTGFEKMTHNYHDAVRKHLLRGEFVHKHRAILVNNWEATYMDFDGEKILSIAKKAAELGVEMLVLDDGWFGKRNNDDSSLGDWFTNEEKLGCSMGELAKKINDLGLKFGLWFEPEMISEDSDLYRAHPDYRVKVPGRMGARSRDQFVLDFTRKEVVDTIEGMIRNILDHANIEYVKWDMNRSICDIYSIGLNNQTMGEFHYRYMVGLYGLLERLTQDYPHILFEGCSSGGGRYDLGMFHYHPQIWCSDGTDAIERLKIQYGSSFLYPIGCCGAHVSASPNHQTGRVASIETRATVAMDGSFGYELDLNQLSRKEQSAVRAQVKEYLKYDQLIHEGDYYRLNSPYDASRVTAWQHMSKDKTKGLLSVVVQVLDANPTGILVYPRGLKADAKYKIGNEIRFGSSWMQGGYRLPSITEEYQSFRLEIKKVR